MNIEILRLDGKRLLELELVRGVDHDEVEPLEDRDERDLRFLPGEWTTLSADCVLAASLQVARTNLRYIRASRSRTVAKRWAV